MRLSISLRTVFYKGTVPVCLGVIVTCILMNWMEANHLNHIVGRHGAIVYFCSFEFWNIEPRHIEVNTSYEFRHFTKDRYTAQKEGDEVPPGIDPSGRVNINCLDNGVLDIHRATYGVGFRDAADKSIQERCRNRYESEVLSQLRNWGRSPIWWHYAYNRSRSMRKSLFHGWITWLRYKHHCNRDTTKIVQQLCDGKQKCGLSDDRHLIGTYFYFARHTQKCRYQVRKHLAVLMIEYECVRPNTWAEWSPWSTCTGCTQGETKKRTRYCHVLLIEARCRETKTATTQPDNYIQVDGENCIGLKEEIRSCPKNITCTLPVWASWENTQRGEQQCPCGGGIGIVQNRKCVNNFNGQFLNVQDCCQIGVPCNYTIRGRCQNRCYGQGWSEWTSWPPCPVTCIGHWQVRYRVCDVGAGAAATYGQDDPHRQCSGHWREERVCNRVECPIVEWEIWNEWSQCSQSCGAGIRKRHRCKRFVNCTESSRTVQNELCVLENCPVNEERVANKNLARSWYTPPVQLAVAFVLGIVINVLLISIVNKAVAICAKMHDETLDNVHYDRELLPSR